MIQRLYKTIYRQLGWKVVGKVPDVPKMVLIGAPHTSWHDFYMGLLFRKVINREVNFIGKKELFNPLTSWYFKSVGGIPLDRTSGQGKVEVIANLFKQRDELILAISPEGTRKSVKEWKTGFYYIALAAKVPILPMGFDYKNKTHILFDLFYPTGNVDEDIKHIRALYAGIEGKKKREE